MKKKIPFDLFGEKQELCFTIPGIAELECSLGKSIQQITLSGNAGVDFCLKALPICLEPCSPHVYVKKIEDYLDVEGRSINDISTPIVHAMIASGALGKASANTVLRIYYPELYPEVKVEEDAKNE